MMLINSETRRYSRSNRVENVLPRIFSLQLSTGFYKTSETAVTLSSADAPRQINSKFTDTRPLSRIHTRDEVDQSSSALLSPLPRIAYYPTHRFERQCITRCNQAPASALMSLDRLPWSESLPPCCWSDSTVNLARRCRLAR